MKMTDEIAIQQTLNRYTIGASQRNWDQVMSTFLPEGVWSVPGQGLEVTGHDNMRAAMSGFVAMMDYFVQMNTPVIRECGKFAGRDEALEVLGFYADELVRTAEGSWKFARRTFTSAGLHRFTLMSGPALG
jgi:ketosteroid isomerase-like protein